MLKEELLELKNKITEVKKLEYDINSKYHGAKIIPDGSWIENNDYQDCFNFKFDCFDYTEGFVNYTFLDEDNDESDPLVDACTIEQFFRHFEIQL